MSNRLPILQDEASRAHLDSLRHKEFAAERALAAGSALVEAKALCGHGAWSAWLKSTGIPERTAQRYMKLHRGGFKPATVADLGMAKAEAMASAGLELWPDAGRAKVCSFKDAHGIEGFAVWWQIEPMRVRYKSLALVPCPSLDAITCEPEPLSPWALGAVHEWHRCDFHHIEGETIPEAERLAEIVAQHGRAA